VRKMEGDVVCARCGAWYIPLTRGDPVNDGWVKTEEGWLCPACKIELLEGEGDDC